MPIQSSKRLAFGLLSLSLYTGLSACGPGPTSMPTATPSTQPTASSSPSPIANPIAAASLRFRLVADPSLTRFKTAQADDFALCLAQIARASTRFSFNGRLSAATSAALTAAGTQVETSGDSHIITFSSAANLAQLLAGISLTLPEVPAGSIEGRTTFFNAASTEIGFVTWQATLNGGAQDVTVTLSEADGASNPVSNACPRLKANVSGATLRGAGGQVTSGNGGPSATPTPGTSTSSPAPTPTPDSTPGVAPGVPTGMQVVEQGATYLTLQWDFPSDARSFKLYLDGREVAANHVTPNYYRYEGLRASTNYTLGVRSVNAAGESAIVDTRGTTLGEGGRSASGNFSSGGNGNTSSKRDDDQELVQISDNSEAGSLISEVAINDKGRSVVTWFELMDFATVKIRGQVFDKDGEAVSTQFFVPTETTFFSLGSPAVAMDEDGAFAIAWSEYSNGSPDVFVQMYEPDGDPIGSRFIVNQFTSGAQKLPDIAMNEDGEFVLTWLGNGAGSGNTNVYARRFDADGSALSSDLLVDPTTLLLNTYPAVAMDDSGSFAVTWNSPTDTLQKFRRFDADDNAGSVITLSENRPYNGFSLGSGINTADIAMSGSGDAVVSWFENQDSALQVKARSLSDDDQPGEIIDVATESTSEYGVSSGVAINDEGQFIVTWGGDPTRLQTGEDTYSLYSQTIKAQRFFAIGRKRGKLIELKAENDFEVNLFPAIAMNSDGEFILSLSAAEAIDGENIKIFDVYTQRFSE